MIVSVSRILSSTKILCSLIIFSCSILAQNPWSTPKKISITDLNSIAFTNNEKGWIGGDGGLVLRTIDSGNTWAKQVLNTKENINEVYFRNDDNGFILAGDRLFMMIDGSDWREQSLFTKSSFPGKTVELYSIRFSDKKRGWIVGSINQNETVVDSILLKTEDSGASWRRVIVPTLVELIHLDFVNESKGWIVGEKGTVLATEDGGKSWVTQITKTEATIYSVDFRNENEGIAVGSKGLILRTEDGGRNWVNATSRFPGTLWRIAFLDEKRCWAAGRGGIVLFSNDKGKNWTKQASNTTENLFGFFVGKKQVWAVGAKGVLLSSQK